ncbi:hypothetical protein ACIO7M_17815 [Streptomyces toxytricini]|uniref:Uncharacterized protein n=1 Tax=Streptomyces toxytricini TaxID=67369 RepID=A0ABW8EM47_STRT5
MSSVDGLAAVGLGGRGLLWAGEGSYGSEGFIARLTPDRNLTWAMFFTDSNPFTRIHLAGGTATFASTSGTRRTVHIEDPALPSAAPTLRARHAG